MTVIVWLRNDLRVADNPALHEACERAGDGPVLAVYLVSAAQHASHNEGASRLGFVRECLATLREDLTALNIPLWIGRAPWFEDAPAALLEIAKQCDANAIYFNAEYPLNEARRDRAVLDACSANGIEGRMLHGDVILPPGSVTKDDGEPYSVFTPFKRRWQQRAGAGELTPLPEPKSRSRLPDLTVPDPEALDDLPDRPANADWPAGEAAALKRLSAFVSEHLERYGDDRDYPAKAATSRLSPYLSVGAISARTCYHRAAPAGEPAAAWLSELVWREFYRHLVSQVPHVSMGYSFKRELDGLPWRNDPEGLEAWKAGQTGFPLVDAGMRQLAETGFMHNRLRMVTAMFLTKHLLVHWREGERHFMEHLRDADYASNNGGWQWSASTGTDAAPYFRIFNPESQAKKFDAKFEFIRDFVPEFGTPAYPEPIVEHAAARQRALDVFRAGPV